MMTEELSVPRLARDGNSIRRYLGNSPVNATDPTGLEQFIPTNKWFGNWARLVEAGVPGIMVINGQVAQAEQVVNTAEKLVQGDVKGAITGPVVFASSNLRAAGAVDPITRSIMDRSSIALTGTTPEELERKLDPKAAERGVIAGPNTQRAIAIITAFATCPNINLPSNVKPWSAGRPASPVSARSEAAASLASHAQRPGWPGPKPSGNAANINRQAYALVDDILNHPNRDVWTGPHPRPEWGGTVTEVYRPDGLGVRFDANGQFIGFITR